MTMINNLPNYAYDHPFTVARRVDGDWWFYGAYDTRDRAADVAFHEEGEVFTVDEIKPGNW